MVRLSEWEALYPQYANWTAVTPWTHTHTHKRERYTERERESARERDEEIEVDTQRKKGGFLRLRESISERERTWGTLPAHACYTRCPWPLI